MAGAMGPPANIKEHQTNDMISKDIFESLSVVN
jgi:hypothetical protein